MGNIPQTWTALQNYQHAIRNSELGQAEAISVIFVACRRQSAMTVVDI